MKVAIIFQLFVLTLVKAHSDLTHYSTNPSAVYTKGCCDLRTFPVSSGVYKISTGTFSTTNVYCDMSTKHGGWTVIQRNRKNSELSFNRNWREYEEGFGDLSGDFWAGLKLMHALTQSGQWEMRVDYQKEDKNWTYLHYNKFSIESASKNYQLFVDEYTGEVVFDSGDPFTGGVSIRIPNGMEFSTHDNDNDRYRGNCARDWGTGWWHNYCYRINLNRQPPEYDFPQIIALLAEMKIRPKGCITQ